MDATTALAIYRAEKDKALRERRVSHVQLMAEAQEAFRKMLADAQLARKGGRPKGSTNAATAAPAASVVTTQSVSVSTSKLVFKPAKTAPAKTPEKVIAAVETLPKAKAAPRKAAAGKAAATKAAATKVEKRPPEKRRSPAKAKAVAKTAAKHSPAASARKGSAKKAAAPRKQAAARERKAKNHKR